MGSGNRLPRWTSAVDGRDADPFPYNHPYQSYEVSCNAVPAGPTPWGTASGSYSPNCTSSTTTLSGPHIQCYSYAIHQSYRDAISRSSQAAFDWDFGLIDFSACGNHPGDSLGWIGAQTLTETQIEGANGNLWGYPGGVQTTGSLVSVYTQWWANPIGSTAAFEEGEIWGSNGSVTVDDNSNWILDYTIDTSGGQSGSLVWRTLSGTRVGYGNHYGGNTSENHARRFDSTVESFATANTAYPN